jgi:hypothetical protein
MAMPLIILIHSDLECRSTIFKANVNETDTVSISKAQVKLEEGAGPSGGVAFIFICE